MMPTAPQRFFASDNNAAVHPAILDAIIEVNHGHTVAYGDDPVTRHTEGLFDEIFGRPVSTFFVWNGTGANVTALACALPPAGAVICTSCAHIHVDETGAPERFLGAKLIDLPHVGGKLDIDLVHEAARDLGVVHHVQPSVVSLTQSTEWGTVYSIDEIGTVCEIAHGYGMTVHVDGARIANAVTALGGGVDTLRAMLVETGVDMVSFGGTKNGMMYGEAVVFLNPDLARRAGYVRKQTTQLPSKVRYIAAQFRAMFSNDLWLTTARHANAMCLELYNKVKDVPGLHVSPPQVNSLYPTLPPSVREPLREWSFFYDWDTRSGQVRWMTSWDTTSEDIDSFCAGLEVLSR